MLVARTAAFTELVRESSTFNAIFDILACWNFLPSLFLYLPHECNVYKVHDFIEVRKIWLDMFRKLTETYFQVHVNHWICSLLKCEN